MSIASTVLESFCLLLSIAFIVSINSLHGGGDAAGNGMIRGFAFLLGIALFSLLLVLTIGVMLAGGITPMTSRVIAMVAVPAAGAAALAVIDLVGDGRFGQPWAQVIPLVSLLLILSLNAVEIWPSSRAALPPMGQLLGWSLVLLVSLLPWRPFQRMNRQRAAHQEWVAEQYRQTLQRDAATVPATQQ